MSDELKIAIEAAKIGAEEALKHFNNKIEVEFKADDTIVTNADISTENVIKKFIFNHDKTAKFVGEETGGNVNQGTFWIIDPIDGTRSFSRGVPTWCTIISLCKKDEIELSVIYSPFLNTVHHSQKGQGAFVNDERVHVSSISESKDVYLGYGSWYHFKDKKPLINLLNYFDGARCFEMTYSNCLVVEGKMDAAVDAFGKVWDMAPFKVMVEEAGGKITKLDGSPWTLDGFGAVISNGIMHDKVIQLLNER